MPQEQLVKLQHLWGLGIRTADGLERKLVCFSLKLGGLRQSGGKLPNRSPDKKQVLCRLHSTERELSELFLDDSVRRGVPQFPQGD